MAEVMPSPTVLATNKYVPEDNEEVDVIEPKPIEPKYDDIPEPVAVEEEEDPTVDAPKPIEPPPDEEEGEEDRREGMLALPKEQVKAMHEAGKLSDEDVQDYIVYTKIRKNKDGIYSLKPQEVKYGVEKGIISESQTEKYIKYKKILGVDKDSGSFRNPIDTVVRDVKAGFHALTFAVRPFGAIGSAVVAPFAHDYSDETPIGQVISAVQASAIAFKKEALPTDARPNYEGKALDIYVPNLPKALRPGAELAIMLLTDPTSYTLPFAGVIRKGLEASSTMGTQSGIWRNSLEEIMSLVPMKEAELGTYSKLADAADLGDKKAADELARKWKEIKWEVHLGEDAPNSGVLKHPNTIPIKGTDPKYKPNKPLDKVTNEQKQTASDNIYNEMKLVQEGDTESLVLNDTFIARIEKEGTTPSDILAATVKHSEEIFAKSRNADVLTHPDLDKASEALLKSEITKTAKLTGANPRTIEAGLDFVRGVAGGFQKATIRMSAARKVLIDYSEQVAKLVTTALESGNFEAKLKAHEHIQYLAEMQNLVLGIRAEAGRQLQSFRTPWAKSRFDYSGIPKEELKIMRESDEARVIEALEAFSNGKTAKERLRAANMVTRNPILQGLLELKQAALMWHYNTQLTNVLGSSLSISQFLTSKYVGITAQAWIDEGHILKPFSFNATTLGEANYVTAGLQDAFIHAFGTKKMANNPIQVGKNTIEQQRKLEEVGRVYTTLTTGVSQLGRSAKLDGRTRSILREKLGTVGTLITLPFNGVSATDDVFKNIGLYSELYSLSYRKAVAKGLQGNDIHGYVQGVINSIAGNAATRGMADEASEIYYKALAQADYQTFNSKLKGAAGKFKGFLGTPTGLVGRLIALPFFDVIVNITNYAAHSTPLGYLAKTQQDILKGTDKVAKAELLTRWTMGTSMVVLGATLQQKRIYVGAIAPKDRDMMNKAGITDYSINTNALGLNYGWVNVGKLQPVVALVNAGADLAAFGEKAWEYGFENDDGHIKDITEVVSKLMLAVGAPMKNSYAKGVDDVYKSVFEPDKMNLSKFSGNVLASFIPRLSDMTEELTMETDTVKEINSFLDPFLNKFDRDSLPTRRDAIYGTPLGKDKPMFLLFNANNQGDEVDKYLLSKGISVGPPSRTVTFKGASVKLTDEEYQNYNDLIAQANLKDKLTQLVSKQSFRAKPTVIQEEQIKSIISNVREAAKIKLLKGDDTAALAASKAYERMVLEHKGKAPLTSKQKRDELYNK